MPAIGASPPENFEVPGSDEVFPFRVLVAVPKALHIPVFGLGVEARRAEVEVSASSGLDALKKVVSGNTARAVDSGRYGAYLLVDIRRRCGRTALYSTWVAFANQEDAEAFVRDHPRLGLDSMQVAIEQVLSQRGADLQNGAASGRYDLGRLEHRGRLNRALEYVRISDELQNLQVAVFALKKLRETLSASPTVVSVG